MQIGKGYIIGIAGALVIGIIAGYGLWGRGKDEKIGVKQMLLKAIKEVEIIEKANKDLQSRFKKIKDNTEKVKVLLKDNEIIKRQLEDAISKKEELERTIKHIRTEASDAQRKSQEVDALKASHDKLTTQINSLEKENSELKIKLDRISTISTGQKEASKEEVQLPESVQAVR
jgi:predicted RNase H-like nuclease (RuvC/YqgF family)